eukprot:jgi/Phyca11/15735/fgenesh1_pg.PHYCAscaffold_15_\
MADRGSFSFNPEVKLSTGASATSSGQLFNYSLPDSSMAEIEEFQKYIAGFPSVDSPEVFGLHPNADLTYRVKEVSALVGGSTAKASKAGVAETREDIIQQKIRDLLAGLPAGGEEALSEEVAQESTRAHASERWALDDVVYYSEVTDYERLEQIKQPPREGVLVHGLMLDGAAWNRPDGTLVEQEPKRLFAPLPAVYVTAATKAHKKTRAAQDHGPYGAYEAPVYRETTYSSSNEKHGLW